MSEKGQDVAVMEKQKGLVPRLRFPEFREAGEWEGSAIGEILVAETSSLALNSFADKAGDFPVYGASGIIGHINTYQHDKPYLAIIKDGSGAGKIFILDEKTSILSTLLSLKAKEAINLAWSYYLLAGIDLSLHLKGSGIPHIYFSDFKNEKIGVPEPKEQQKIADCLSSLDDLITAESKQLDTLKTHKKGLMQQLFPLEGETVPRLRFEEFREAEGWKPKTIGDSCESFSGGTPSTSNKSFYDGEIPFIRSAEISKDKTELFLSNKGLENSAARIVKVGDILVALYGANSGDVALSNINGAINQAILCLRHETNNRFVYQYLTHKKEWIIATFIQGGQGNLSGEIVKAIFLFFPEPNEQQKIADCLSSLDDLISAQSKKIETLKTFKKGLMQQLFPVMDEELA